MTSIRPSSSVGAAHYPIARTLCFKKIFHFNIVSVKTIPHSKLRTSKAKMVPWKQTYEIYVKIGSESSSIWFTSRKNSANTLFLSGSVDNTSCWNVCAKWSRVTWVRYLHRAGQVGGIPPLRASVGTSISNSWRIRGLLPAETIKGHQCDILFLEKKKRDLYFHPLNTDLSILHLVHNNFIQDER